MKNLYTLFLALAAAAAFGQDGAPASPYYNGFNFNQTGTALKNALAVKITNTHTNNLTYQEAENALKVTDLDPEDTFDNNLLLVYGFSNGLCPASSSSDNDHRRRNKEADGGGNSCQWNREHIFPQSLGTPDLGQSGPGADAHMLRACDVDRNGMRGNKKFADGSGNSGDSNGGWYPGDEWKGDAARILMYMYLRYGNQCLPKIAAQGATVPTDSNMPLLLLEWNAEDPVSEYEDQRNTYLGNTGNNYGQGNRNPFIDNPYLATLIWGGPAAQDRWAIAGTGDVFSASLSVYPNPAVNHEINIYTDAALDGIELINLNGQLVHRVEKPVMNNSTYTLSGLPQGFYLLKMTSGSQTATRKIVVN